MTQTRSDTVPASNRQSLLDTRPATRQTQTQTPDPGPDGVFAVEAARLLADSHCENVVVYDVRGLSQLTNFILIASGTSDRQMKALGNHVEQLGEAHDMERLGSERDEATTWIVLDFIDVMIHLFEPLTRAHYDLEMLWGDAPRVAIASSG